MKWANKFYSTTGTWWGPAEYKVTDRDYDRVSIIKRISPESKTVLELGSGYGNTASACAESGFNTTAIELSDRIEYALQYEEKEHTGSLKFIKGSFYDVQLSEKFDVVAYWNGLGLGFDEDQRNLLKRIANEWLNPNGMALIDVQNPFVWFMWAEEKELINKKARPEAGYNFNVSEKIEFDVLKNRLIDTWWQTEKPEEKISQDLRCYSPNDLILLLEGTGLKLKSIEVEGKEIDLTKDYGSDNPLYENNEYLAVLVKSN